MVPFSVLYLFQLKQFFLCFLEPRPAQNLYVLATSDTELMLGWEDPDFGGYDNFTVVLEEVNGITQTQVNLLAGRQAVSWVGGLSDSTCASKV